MRSVIVMVVLLALFALYARASQAIGNELGVPYIVEEESTEPGVSTPSADSDHFVLPAVCEESLNIGTGTQSLTRWRFNPKFHACEPFHYKGEGGNNNRFETQLECLTKCTEDPCKKRADDGSTLGALVINGSRVSCLYHHLTRNDNCPANYYCAPESKICCRQETSNGRVRDACEFPKDEGVVGSSTKPSFSYFYNSTSRQCEQFVFKGQGGNQNRFDEWHHCLNACTKRYCPVGRPFSKANGPVACSRDGDDATCPEDYQCIQVEGEEDKNVCCLKGRNLTTDGESGPMDAESSASAASSKLFAVFAAVFVMIM